MGKTEASISCAKEFETVSGVQFQRLLRLGGLVIQEKLSISWDPHAQARLCFSWILDATFVK